MNSPMASSPFKSMLDRVGPKNEKALQTAFYNTAALVFVLIGGIILITAYYVLEAFLRPLIWAALCGAFIFPFKKTMTKVVHAWLDTLKTDCIPLGVGLTLLPLQAVNESVDLLGWIMKSNMKLLAIVFVLFMTAYYLIVYQPFYYILLGIELFNYLVSTILMFFSYPLGVSMLQNRFHSAEFNYRHLSSFPNHRNLSKKIRKLFNSAQSAYFNTFFLQQVWTVVIGFTVLLFYYQRGDDENVVSRNKWLLKYVSLSVWCMLLFHLVTLAGPGQVPLAILLIILIVLGVMNDNHKHQESKPEDVKVEAAAEEPHSHGERKLKRRMTLVDIVDKALNVVGIDTPIKEGADSMHKNDSSQSLADLNNDTGSYPDSNEFFPKKAVEEIQSVKSTPLFTENKGTPSLSKKVALKLTKSKKPRFRKRTKRSSDPYFIALFWIFALSRVWLHQWILQLVPVLFLILVLKTVFIQLEIVQKLFSKTKDTINTVSKFYDDRKDIIFPGPVKGIVSILHSGDQKVISILCNSTDMFMSILIILCMGIVAILAATFFAMQVHHESSYLVTVATNVVNKTIISNQEYLSWMNLDESEVRKTFDTAVHNGYMMARQRMATMISSVVKTQNSTSKSVEADITNVLDQLYETWVAKNKTQKKPIDIAVENLNKNKSNEPIIASGFWNVQWQKYSGYLSANALSKIANLIKENVSTFQSVVDSVWLILKGNMTLVVSMITHIISLVLSSGTYLLNSMVSIIIFTTTLFYLLSSSTNEYKLLAWLSSVSMGTRLGESIDKAIQDVFGASLKMATFYGFYTWFTHSVFGANLIFIPAALAATLGVVPFIGTYWAAIPACLELWLIQAEGIRAVLLLILHFIPTYVVDTAIYSEIGVHPYLTGLAVAGGIICMGLEGAFVGPFVLACLMAAFDVYNRIMGPTTINPVKEGESPFPKLWRRTVSEDNH